MSILIAQHLSPGVNPWGSRSGVRGQIRTEGIPPCVYSRWGSPHPPASAVVLWGRRDGKEPGGRGEREKEEEQEEEEHEKEQKEKREGYCSLCLQPLRPQEHRTPYVPQVTGEGEFAPNILGGSLARMFGACRF